MKRRTYQLGQMVLLKYGGGHRLIGEVVEIEPAILMNGAVLSSEHYKIEWEDGNVSGWLSWYDLEEVV